MKKILSCLVIFCMSASLAFAGVATNGDSGIFVNGTEAGGGGVAGNDTEVQYNDAGTLAGDTGLTWTKASNDLTIGSATVDCGTLAGIMGAQGSDPQWSIAIDNSGNTTLQSDTAFLELQSSSDDVYITATDCEFGTTTLNMGSATQDSAPITLVQGAQTGDPQVILDLTADANGDFSITTDTGDIVLTTAVNIENAIPAAGKFQITATAHTGTDGVIDINTTSGTDNNSGIHNGMASLGMGASEALFAYGGFITTHNTDNASSFQIMYGGTLDDTAAGSGTKIYNSPLPSTNGNWDITYGAVNENLIISPISLSGNGGHSISLAAADADAGDANGGSITMTVGALDGAGNNGVVNIYSPSGGSNDGVELYLINDKTPSTDDDIASISFEDANGTSWFKMGTYALDGTGSAEYAGVEFQMIIDNDKASFLAVEAEDGGADDYEVSYYIAGEGMAEVFLAPGMEDDDTNAGCTFLLEGQEGGESTSGAGYDGGIFEIGGGVGTDAFNGDTNGGDGGNLYLRGGIGGALAGGGADGTDGDLYLGYSNDESSAVGEVIMPTGSALLGEVKTIDVTIGDPLDLSETATLPIWKNRTGEVFNITAIYSDSDTDDVVFTLKECPPTDYTSLTTIEAITISTDGTGVYYNDLTSGIDHTVIEAGNVIVLDNDAADDPDYIHFTIVGYLS